MGPPHRRHLRLLWLRPKLLHVHLPPRRRALVRSRSGAFGRIPYTISNPSPSLCSGLRRSQPRHRPSDPCILVAANAESYGHRVVMLHGSRRCRYRGNGVLGNGKQGIGTCVWDGGDGVDGLGVVGVEPINGKGG